MYSMKTFISVLKLLLLTSITIGVPVYIYLRHPEFIEQFSTLKGVNDFLEKYQAASIFAYIGVQIAQVVISVIPGQFLQFAGGYAYGFWLGYLFAIIGIAIGSSIAFGLARVLGRDALHLLFGEERLTKFVTQLNSKRAFAILVVLYAVPGSPKDIITYAAGVSEFGYLRFLLLSLISRSPALMVTVIMGTLIGKGSYVGPAILAIVVVLLCIVLVLKRHDLTHYIDSIYLKFIEPKDENED
ncbi:MAG: VTT domain-containing protein, partial [Eubacteriales bacterium]|nr:VTT domain-containing protein [Eubacteriales bacterium]